MTERQYVKSKMNLWDKYCAGYAWIIPLGGIIAMIVAAMYIPDHNWHMDNPTLQVMMLIFIVGVMQLIACRKMWIEKYENWKDEYRNKKIIL